MPSSRTNSQKRIYRLWSWRPTWRKPSWSQILFGWGPDFLSTRFLHVRMQRKSRQLAKHADTLRVTIDEMPKKAAVLQDQIERLQACWLVLVIFSYHYSHDSALFVDYFVITMDNSQSGLVSATMKDSVLPVAIITQVWLRTSMNHREPCPSAPKNAACLISWWVRIDVNCANHASLVVLTWCGSIWCFSPSIAWF